MQWRKHASQKVSLTLVFGPMYFTKYGWIQDFLAPPEIIALELYFFLWWLILSSLMGKSPQLLYFMIWLLFYTPYYILGSSSWLELVEIKACSKPYLLKSKFFRSLVSVDSDHKIFPKSSQEEKGGDVMQQKTCSKSCLQQKTCSKSYPREPKLYQKVWSQIFPNSQRRIEEGVEATNLPKLVDQVVN